MSSRNSNSSSSSGYVMTQSSYQVDPLSLYSNIDICSVQSTARPGCILELELLNDSKKVGQRLIDIFLILVERFDLECKVLFPNLIF